MSDSARRTKLGLALAGGGFRASLFHVGVFRRLAELDVLRQVEVLSTVSGGSIIGGLYMLLLKERLQAKARLSKQDYLDLVRELERQLLYGIRLNLRTLLLLNPLGTLRVLLTADSMSNRMARLYERYLYREPARRLGVGAGRSWWRRMVRPGAVRLSELRVQPGGQPIPGGIEAYNAEQVATGGSAVTSIILNATALNSGGRFFFSAVEVGDWYLGFVRRDEERPLLSRKRLLQEIAVATLQAAIEKRDFRALGLGQALDGGSAEESLRVATLCLWWRSRRPETAAKPPAGWEPLFALSRFPGELLEAPLGLLRRAKLPAWYLREGPRQSPPILGGVAEEELKTRVLNALSEIDDSLREVVETELAPEHRDLLLQFIVELYLVRSAERVSPNIDADWDRLTLGDAVGASACFPPVFPPFVLLGIYDDERVARLGLSDGGVFDNTGITALLDEGCNCIIASDTGGVFDELVHAPAGHVGSTLRIPSVLMRAVGNYQRMDLRERRWFTQQLERIRALVPPGAAADAVRQRLQATASARGIEQLAYFHIASPAPAPDRALTSTIDGRELARLRTDLDGFGEIETTALINHGYDTADRFVRSYLTELPGLDLAAPAEWPHHPIGGARVHNVLHAGAARFFRPLIAREPFSLIVAVGAVVLLGWLGWRGLTPAGLAAWFGKAYQWIAGGAVGLAGVLLPAPLDDVAREIPTVAADRVWPWVRDLLHEPRTIPIALALAGLSFALRALAPAVARTLGVFGIRFSWPRTLWKRLVGYRGNLLWFVWALPLLVTVAVSLIAMISLALFYLPWLWYARVRPSDRIGAPVPAERTLLQLQ